MSQYKSALGKTVDMAALAAKNERVRAVGNLPVNARGDTIDSKGNIIVPVTKKVGEKYAQTVTNKSANVTKKHYHPDETSPQIDEHQFDFTPEELEIESQINDDLEVEMIKSKEKK
jgi:hypothetical protein